MTKDFENWWMDQDIMFGNTTNAMYAYCEETGVNFDDLYETYYS